MKIKDSIVKNKINLTKILTKCSKMTEEGDLKRNGINNGAIIGNSLNLSRNHIYGNHQKDGSNLLQKTKLSSISEINDNNTSKRNFREGTGCSGNGNNFNMQSSNSAAPIGGRLQFFKDGKFILELASAREGDRTGWISVPRKTYWPPTAPPPNSSANYNHKNESSTSLSFSDDNSSIQSSPWQRDHCWKQTSPRRNISKEMNFYLYRPPKFSFKYDNNRIAKIKTKRPYDTNKLKIQIFNVDVNKENTIDKVNDEIDNKDTVADEINKETSQTNTTKVFIKQEKEISLSHIDDVFIKKEIEDENDVSESNKILSESLPKDDLCIKKEKNDLNIKKNKIKSVKKSKKLISDVIQKLIERKSNLVVVNAKGTAFSGNVNHYSKLESNLQHVSPRKRILREFEKVSLEDSTILKRSRAKGLHNITNGSNSSSSTSNNVNSNSVTVTATTATISRSDNLMSKPSNGVVLSTLVNSNESSPISQPISRPISSYSITSLLAHNTEKPESNHVPSTDPSQLRAMLSSPKSPEYSRYPKYNLEKKKSPNYNSNLSPKYNVTNANNHSKSPSINDSYGIPNSPALSPSPDQGYRYRTHSSSSPSFHPYMSSSSSRCSPSETHTLSPTSDIYANRYRPGYLIGSPNHNSPYSRQSPNSNYSQKSYSSSKSLNSPTHHLNNLNITANKIRDSSSTSSPRTSPGTDHMKRENNSTPTTSSSSSGTLCPSPVTRTVPKKAAAFRQQYMSGGSPSHSHNHSAAINLMDQYYKTSPQRREPVESLEKNEKDEHKRFNDSLSSSSSMSIGIDEVDAVNLPRPSWHIPPSFHQQSQHGMYLLPPSYHSAASPPGGFMPYYHPMSYVQAAAYRNSMWMQYSGLSSSTRIPPILPFGGPTVDTPIQHQSTTTTPWVPIAQPLNSDPVALVRIKDEPCTDVPLNLSKH